MQSRRFRSVRLGAAVATAVAALAAWSACSVEKDYEILSFFFDGVPVPGAAEGAAAARRNRGASAVGRTASRHSAYVERRCAECHGEKAKFGFRSEGFSEMTAAVCVKCHESEEPLAFRHGPVAAGLCLACHEAHASVHPKLLVEPSPTLCLECHAPELASQSPGSVHADLDRDCLECHEAHGGATRYFLLPESEWDEPVAEETGTDEPSAGEPTGEESLGTRSTDGPAEDPPASADEAGPGP